MSAERDVRERVAEGVWKSIQRCAEGVTAIRLWPGEARALLRDVPPEPVESEPSEARHCGEAGPKGYLCTRPTGHEGAHEARDDYGVFCALWELADEGASER